MNTPHPEPARLDAGATVSFEELRLACDLSGPELQELIGHGALSPIATREGQRHFSADCLAPMKPACNLRREHHLDMFTVALLMGYLRRIAQLEHELHALRAGTSHHPPASAPHRDAPRTWHEPHGR